MESIITIPVKELSAINMAASKKNHARFCLEGVFVEVAKDGGYSLTATDGWILANINLFDASEVEHSFVIPSIDIKRLEMIGGEKVEIVKNDLMLKYHLGNRELQGTEINATYPDYRRAISIKEDAAIDFVEFNFSFFKKAHKIAKMLFSKKDASYLIKINKDNIAKLTKDNLLVIIMGRFKS